MKTLEQAFPNLIIRKKPEDIKELNDMPGSTIMIYHHTGMGDHISLSSLVRRIAKDGNYEKVYLICFESNNANVCKLYQDSEVIEICTIPNRGDHNTIIKQWVAKKNQSKFLQLGFDDWGRLDGYKGLYVDTLMYAAAGYPVKTRWDDYYFQRDEEAEETAFKKVNPDNRRYIFIHDPGDEPQHQWRGRITDSLVRRLSTSGGPASGGQQWQWIDGDEDTLIIRNNPSIPLMHMGKILENACELHMMESSLRCFAEGLDTSRVQHYHHHYIRDHYNIDHGTRKVWMVVEEYDPEVKLRLLNGPAQLDHFDKYGTICKNLHGFYCPTWF
mgnify:FL=1